MYTNVLVGYATKYQATAEIARQICRVIREAGFQTDLYPVEQVRDLTPYGAVVLGSAVYAGQWRSAAATFLKTHERALAQRPVWVFSSGPTGHEALATVLKGWRFPEGLLPVLDRIGPRDCTVFRGALNLDRLNFLERWMIGKIKAPTGDFREWDAIDAWARSIAAELEGGAVPAGNL